MAGTATILLQDSATVKPRRSKKLASRLLPAIYAKALPAPPRKRRKRPAKPPPWVGSPLLLVLLVGRARARERSALEDFRRSYTQQCRLASERLGGPR